MIEGLLKLLELDSNDLSEYLSKYFHLNLYYSIDINNIYLKSILMMSKNVWIGILFNLKAKFNYRGINLQVYCDVVINLIFIGSLSKFTFFFKIWNKNCRTEKWLKLNFNKFAIRIFSAAIADFQLVASCLAWYFASLLKPILDFYRIEIAVTNFKSI